MTVEGECAAFLADHSQHRLRVAEDVAVHEQEFLASHHLARYPQRVDVVVVGIVGVVEEDEVELGIMRLEKRANHLGFIASDHYKALHTGHAHGIDSAFQEVAVAKGQETFGHVVGEWAQAACHAGGEYHACGDGGV